MEMSLRIGATRKILWVTVLGFVNVVCLFQVAAASPPPTLDSTVYIFHDEDLDLCEQQVERAAQLGNRRVHFLITFGFISYRHDYLKSFCWKRSERNCQWLNDEHVSHHLKSKLAICFRQAFHKHNLEIAVTAHVNDTEPKSLWRNNFGFDPLQKGEANSASYYSGVLSPITEAIHRAEIPGPKLIFSLQGEMGATIGNYPDKWFHVFEQMKKDLPGGARIGISLNFNKIFGDHAHPIFRRLFDHEELLTKLFEAVDFVGVSNYAQLSYDTLNENGFSSAIFSFFLELTSWTPNSFPRIKNFLFSEIGIGGGSTRNDGKSVARSIHELLAVPWSGIMGPFHESRNPWKWEDFRSVRRDYYRALLEFLQSRPVFVFKIPTQLQTLEDAHWLPNARTHRVPLMGSFQWNLDSWDVQGLHPWAVNYRDGDIVQWIQEYNRER